MLLCGKLSAVKRETIASCRSLSLAYNTPCRMRYGQAHVAVGSLGMAVAALTFLPVLIEVSGWYLMLHTAAWAAQMLDCSRMSSVLRSVASAFSILLALVVCFGLLVLVSTTMVLSVGVA